MRTLPWALTKDDVAALHRRRDAAGGERFDTMWAELIADIRAAMDRGIDPRSDGGLALATRWQTLVTAFSGGDSAIERGLYERAEIYARIRAEAGEPIPDLVGFIRQAFEN